MKCNELFIYPTTNGGMQNGSLTEIHCTTHCTHIFAHLAEFCMISRCLLTIFFSHWSSVRSLLRVRCWLGMRVIQVLTRASSSNTELALVNLVVVVLLGRRRRVVQQFWLFLDTRSQQLIPVGQSYWQNKQQAATTESAGSRDSPTLSIWIFDKYHHFCLHYSILISKFGIPSATRAWRKS